MVWIDRHCPSWIALLIKTNPGETSFCGWLDFNLLLPEHFWIDEQRSVQVRAMLAYQVVIRIDFSAVGRENRI